VELVRVELVRGVRVRRVLLRNVLVRYADRRSLKVLCSSLSAFLLIVGWNGVQRKNRARSLRATGVTWRDWSRSVPCFAGLFEIGPLL
jgi:hypothetical protein